MVGIQTEQFCSQKSRQSVSLKCRQDSWIFLTYLFIHSRCAWWCSRYVFACRIVGIVMIYILGRAQTHYVSRLNSKHLIDWHKNYQEILINNNEFMVLVEMSIDSWWYWRFTWIIEKTIIKRIFRRPVLIHHQNTLKNFTAYFEKLSKIMYLKEGEIFKIIILSKEMTQISSDFNHKDP